MLEIIKRTGVFLIIAETMYQFIQENRYARYVRLLIRIMTMAILIIPVLEFIKGGSSHFFYERLTAFEQQYEELILQGEARFQNDENMQDVSNIQNEENKYGNRMNLAVTQGTCAYIKSICNKWANEKGYEIMSVSVNNDVICFYVSKKKEDANQIVLTDEISIHIGEGDENSIFAEEYTQDVYEKSDGNVNEEKKKLRMAFAGFLNINEMNIEVVIYE